MNLKHKEAVMEVRRHLVEAASRENLPVKMSMGKLSNVHACMMQLAGYEVKYVCSFFSSVSKLLINLDYSQEGQALISLKAFGF